MFQAVTSFIARRRAGPVQLPMENAVAALAAQMLRQPLTMANRLYNIDCLLASWEEGLITADDAQNMIRHELRQIAEVAA